MEPVELTQEAAIWLLNLAHVECDGLQMELNAANRARQRARELEAECAALRIELAPLRDECARLREYRERAADEAYAHSQALAEAVRELDTLRAELDALRAAAPAPTGWVKVGDWAWANPDGRIVRQSKRVFWLADDGNERWLASDAVDAAREAGWHDFPDTAEPTP